MCFLIIDYKQKCSHIQHLSYTTRSFINPFVNSVLNFLKRFVNIIFDIKYCFSSRIKINRSKFYISFFFFFFFFFYYLFFFFFFFFFFFLSFLNKPFTVIWYLQPLTLSKGPLNKSLMLDIVASNWAKGSFESTI